MFCNTQGKFLGYYFGLGAFLSTHPHGVPGNCFINGETQSLWIWDEVNRKWVDSNRLDSPFQGLIENPQKFNPKPKAGIKAVYLYFAPKSGTVTFDYLRNKPDSEDAISVEVTGSSIIMLYWDGDYWSVEVIPMENNIEELKKKHEQDISELESKVREVISGSINVGSGFDVLDKYIGITTVNHNEYIGGYGWFTLKNGFGTVGLMSVTTDSMQHEIHQTVYGNFSVEDGKLSTSHTDGQFGIYTRVFALSSASANHNGIKELTWTKWKRNRIDNIGNDKTSESGDGTVWGELKSLKNDLSGHSNEIQTLKSTAVCTKEFSDTADYPEI